MTDHNPHRSALLKQAALTVGKIGPSAVALPEVAELSGVPLDSARALYSDEQALLKDLYEFAHARCENYVQAELLHATSEEEPTVTLKRVGSGIFTFSQEEKYNFSAFMRAESTHVKPVDFNQDFATEDFRLIYRTIMELTRQIMLNMKAEQDLALLTSAATGYYSGIIGYCHLASVGIFRMLSKPAKWQTFSVAMDTALAGLTSYIERGTGVALTPTQPVGLPEPTTLVAATMPRETREEKVEAILRGAVEVALRHGVPSITVAASAKQAGISPHEAESLFDGDERLLKQLEDSLDERDQTFIGTQLFAQPGGTLAINYIKAIGLGYLGFALHDPASFEVLIEISSGAIVPTSFDENSFEGNEMGKAFGVFMDFTRMSIEEGDGERSPWVLYTQVVAMWSIAHGFGMLTALGSLSSLSFEDKVTLMNSMLDIAALGMVAQLRLNSEIATEELPPLPVIGQY